MGAKQSLPAPAPLFEIQTFFWGLKVRFNTRDHRTSPLETTAGDHRTLPTDVTTGHPIELTVKNGALKYYRIVEDSAAAEPAKCVVTSFTAKGEAVMRVVKEAASGEEALLAARKHLPPTTFSKAGMPITVSRIRVFK